MHHRHRLLTAAALVAVSVFSATAHAATVDLKQGHDLYLIKCTKCHKMWAPADYSDADWQTWMDKMKKKAHLSDEQFRLISEYTASLRDK